MITSHCAISFCSDCEIIWDWIVWICPHLIAKNNRENPSKIIESPIKTQTKFAIAPEEIAVNIDSKTNIHHNVAIHHHKGIVSLCCIPKKINIPHLTNAHKANIHIINFPTKFASLAQASMNPRMIPKIHMTKRKDTYGFCLFFIALIMADIPPKIIAIHNRIFMIHRKLLGLKTVKNQNNMSNIAIHNSNPEDRLFIFSVNEN